MTSIENRGWQIAQTYYLVIKSIHLSYESLMITAASWFYVNFEMLRIRLRDIWLEINICLNSFYKEGKTTIFYIFYLYLYLYFHLNQCYAEFMFLDKNKIKEVNIFLYLMFHFQIYIYLSIHKFSIKCTPSKQEIMKTVNTLSILFHRERYVFSASITPPYLTRKLKMIKLKMRKPKENNSKKWRWK